MFERSEPTVEPAAGLLLAAEEALTDLYGPTVPLPRELLLVPDGCYLVAWHAGRSIAGGGFTRHAERTAEIRRMFVVPGFRSRGVARRLLAALEDELRRAGYQRAILDTGAKQPHAEALYRDSGYVDIENFRGPASRASFWGAKDL